MFAVDLKRDDRKRLSYKYNHDINNSQFLPMAHMGALGLKRS